MTKTKISEQEAVKEMIEMSTRIALGQLCLNMAKRGYTILSFKKPDGAEEEVRY